MSSFLQCQWTTALIKVSTKYTKSILIYLNSLHAPSHINSVWIHSQFTPHKLNIQHRPQDQRHDIWENICSSEKKQTLKMDFHFDFWVKHVLCVSVIAPCYFTFHCLCISLVKDMSSITSIFCSQSHRCIAAVTSKLFHFHFSYQVQQRRQKLDWPLQSKITRSHPPNLSI